MAEDVELTSAQTDKLLQFQDLTGIEEMERCRAILETHNWDLEMAVQDTLNINEGAPSVFRPPSNSPPPVVVSPPNQRVFYSVRSWQPTGILGWGFFTLTLPFHIAFNIFLSLKRFFLGLIRPDASRNATDPLTEVQNFIRNFQEKYQNSHPVFYQGTYHQALNGAKQDLKFLLVYLHGEDHQDTDQFCREVLGNEAVIEFVNRNCLFWACSVNSSEGYKVSQALRENTYPFLAVVVLRDNRMTVVARLEGPTQPDVLLRRLQTIVTENEAALIAVRLERQERSLNQSIRQQQDEAYEQSLKVDQEKERKKREEQRLKEQEENEHRELLLAEQQRKEEIQQRKIFLASEIPDEPPVGDSDTVRVLIKLANGFRMERRFDKSHSLKHLYYFVFCHPQSPDSFQVVTNFPRRVVPCEPTDANPEPLTFEEFGFGPSEMLFVQDLEA